MDSKESTTTLCEFGCLSLPSSPTIYLIARRLPPTFWSSARFFCVCLFYLSPKQTTPPPSQFFLYLHHTPIITRARHDPFHHKACQTPNLPLPFHPPSLTTHAPTWCRGNWPSTGQRAAYSPNETPSGSCSSSATTLSGLSSTPPLGGQ